jgi:membrane protein implicated in regulation of membrane protease activity
MDSFKEWAKPELIWFLVGLVLLLLEFAAPGLIIFFFGVGAWIVAAICLFTDVSLNIQLVIFLITSVLLLLSLRKWLKTIFVGHVGSKQNLDELLQEFVGEKAIVKKQITPELKGRVEFHGSNWDAKADETIEEGTPVEIIGKKNITLKVKSLKGGKL